MVKTSDHLPRWNDQRFHNSTQVAINYSTVNIYAYSAAIPLSVIGFIANLLLLYLIKSDRHFRSMTYNLIQISVISDLLSLMGTMTGFTLVAAVKIGYFWGSILCKCLLFTIFISYGVSITTLCMISIDRYLAIVKPISVTTLKYKKRLVYVGQCLGCLITLGIALPILYLANVYREDTKFCDVPNVSVSTAVYLVLQGVFMYLIPMLILVITYGKIVKYQTHYVQPGQVKQKRRKDGHLKKKKFIRALIFITLIYFLTTWPFFATCAGMAITAKSLLQIRLMGLQYYLFAFFSFISTFGISIINPFIYFKFDYSIRMKLISRFRYLLPMRLNNVNQKTTVRATSRYFSQAVNQNIIHHPYESSRIPLTKIKI